jgi:Uma2 family endonuclease
MATQPAGLTWTELQSWPEDGNRYELLGGELVVSPSPGLRHQEAVMAIALALGNWAAEHGGKALTGPFDVYVHEREYTEPDVLYVRPERTHLFEEQRLPAPPDLLVEVSSSSTRARDLGVKRDIYERFGVPEYWFVDLDRDEVLVFTLSDDGYGDPHAYRTGEDLRPACCPGLAIPVDRVLA